MKIIVKKDGPYVVNGNIPLVRKTQIFSEQNEPLTWEKGEPFETKEIYTLCRCGRSKQKPFCDGTHGNCGFDGTETADTEKTSARQMLYRWTEYIAVKFDKYLCTGSGFCINKKTNIARLVARAEDINIRYQVISMIQHCPSGALTFAMKPGDPDIEPDLPKQIATTTEITSHGLVEGPLWVTGNIPVERADGQPFEIRNRVTLCSCGQSKIKPLCDGTHRRSEEK